MAESVLSSAYEVDDADDDGGSSAARCLATLKFPDDFAEFQARADSGGSTYGVLKRHAFAQQSLRVVAPSDPEVDVIVPQRRANSLVPPPSAEAASRRSSGDAVDQKMIIAVLCSEPSPRQQRRHRYHHHHHHHKRQQHQRSDQHKHRQLEQQPIIKKMDTLQVYTDS